MAPRELSTLAPTAAVTGESSGKEELPSPQTALVLAAWRSIQRAIAVMVRVISRRSEKSVRCCK